MRDNNIPDISVIVISYNIEEYIGECLDSILSQEGPSLECICVDDASTDATYSILERYAMEDHRIRLIRNDNNAGQSSTRNVGFKNASGKYLYCIDGDDYLCAGALKRLYSCAEENCLDLLGFSATSFFENEYMKRFGTEEEYVRKGTYLDVKSGAELFADLIAHGDRVSANVVMYFFRCDYFRKNSLYGLEGLRYADDSIFAMYMAAERAMYIPDRLYMRRYREGSTCTSPMKKCYMESLIVLFLHELQIWRNYSFNALINEKIEKYFNSRFLEIKAFYKQFQNDSTETLLLNKDVVAKYFYKYFIAEEPLRKECFTKEEMLKIKEADTVILYGAGFIAKEAAKTLEYNGVEDYQVAVTSKEPEYKQFREKEVFSIYEIECKKENAFVVVAMSRKNYDTVIKILKTLGYQDICWVSL